MIYILDYDTDIACVLNNWLQLDGFKTRSFTTVEQLFLNLKIQHPDCILLDCKYGKMAMLSGICRTIRNEFKYTGRIIITSTSAISDSDVQLCNADGFMGKPFDYAGMADKINEQLEQSNLSCAA